MKVDKSLINTLNKQNVINIIRDNGPIFKAEISRVTGLSIPTVMKMADEFILKGLVREVGKGESSGGKPPLLIEFVPDAHYIIGVDIGTTNIVSIIMDMSAQIVSKQITPTGVKDPPDVVIDRIIGTIGRTLDETSVKKEKILGIGIGMPGLLDSQSGIVLFSPDFKWENVDLVGPIRKKYGMPVIMDNVTRAMAMGEKWFGLGRGISNFMCINLGYGIGSAIVVDGELYSGSSGSSGEFGHMTLEKNGPLCDCGNYGCLEALASANAITKKAKFFIEKGEGSSILKLAGGDIDGIEAKTVFDAAKSGDMLALEIVHEAAEYIGIALANIINLVDPELIILEGGVARAGEILSGTIQKVVGRRKMKYAGTHTNIAISELGENSAAIGAASFLLKRLIENGGALDLI